MNQLKELFCRWTGQLPAECLAIGQSSGGSSRRYYRLVGAGVSAIGTIGSDLRENEAFVAFTRHLHAKQMPVPELYAVSTDGTRYLQQDLGDTSLYSILYRKKQQGGGFDSEMLALYRKALADLARIQQAGRDMDFSLAFPRPAFDRRSIMWDLNYFKYNFLKLTETLFDEERLENDFVRLADCLLAADTTYFLYRDFQSRNIMVCGASDLYYIDYQGGRQGAAQYDVASLLYSAKSDLPQAIRDELLRHYIKVAGITNETEWTGYYYAYVLLRILQTLGAYGYRGIFQHKDYFLQSIPLAQNNLAHLLQEHPMQVRLPEIERIAGSLHHTGADTPAFAPNTTLTVTVSSFSYKQGLPSDPSGNGGGHVFDCRALPNPGRYDQYKCYTGKDRPVIEFLQKEEPVLLFLQHTQAIVRQSVDKYIERGFSHLMVSFGCTGGQHRSVYCAEQTALWLRTTYPAINVIVRHREQDRPPCA